MEEVRLKVQTVLIVKCTMSCTIILCCCACYNNNNNIIMQFEARTEGSDKKKSKQDKDLHAHVSCMYTVRVQLYIRLKSLHQTGLLSRWKVETKTPGWNGERLSLNDV